MDMCFAILLREISAQPMNQLSVAQRSHSMNNQADLARAKKVVNARIGFYIHLTAYLVVNALLIFINLATSTERLWFQWPLFGWGLGIVAHAVVTFGLPGVRSRMIDKEMQKRAPKE